MRIQYFKNIEKQKQYHLSQFNSEEINSLSFLSLLFVFLGTNPLNKDRMLMPVLMVISEY